MNLHWKEAEIENEHYYHVEANGVRFILVNHPQTSQGIWQLLIELCDLQWRELGYVDAEARWYHDLENAKSEAALIAEAMWKEREKRVSVDGKPLVS